MNLFSMFTRSVTSLGNAIDHGAAMAASRLAKSAATRNAFGLGAIGALGSRPGGRAAWGMIGGAMKARQFAMSPMGRSAGMILGAGVAGSAIGMGIAPRGRRGWGAFGGPIGGLAARMVPGRRR